MCTKLHKLATVKKQHIAPAEHNVSSTRTHDHTRPACSAVLCVVAMSWIGTGRIMGVRKGVSRFCLLTPRDRFVAGW